MQEGGDQPQRVLDSWVAGSLGLVGALLALMLISTITPIVVTRGNANSLPASYCGVWNGAIHYGALSSLPALPANPTEGGRRHMFHHWISVFGAVTVDSNGIHGFPVTRTLSDRHLPLTVTSAVSVPRACYTRLTIFPRGPLLLCALLCVYPTVAFLRGPYRRFRRARKGLCLHCGYNLTGNVSGICPECGQRIQEAT